MNGESLNYMLKFRDFTLEFSVNLQRSMDETRAFQSGKTTDFAYVISDIELRVKDGKYLVSSEFNTGNLAEFLRHLSRMAKQPASLLDVCRGVPRGGVCAWLQAYWQRIDQETASAEDERIYDSLIPFCVISEDVRGIAIYDYAGLATIEVAAEAAGSKARVIEVADFDPAALHRDVDQLREALTTALRERISVQ